MTKIDRLTADEDGMVYACPECDRAGNVYRRHGTNTHVGDPDDPYACGECSATFEEPNKRESKRKGPTSGGGNLSKLERILQARKCPGCDTEGDGDDVLANNQRWCPDPECRVVSFRGGVDD